MRTVTAAAGVTAGLAAGAAALGLLARRFVVVTVRGRSMEPAYRSGDRVLVRRGARPSVGQVVVVALGEGWIIKRVAGLPGDTVRLDRLPPPYGDRDTRVPEGRIVLFGDNPDGSVDSRDVGPFAAADVLGVVARRL